MMYHHVCVLLLQHVSVSEQEIRSQEARVQETRRRLQHAMTRLRSIETASAT